MHKLFSLFGKRNVRFTLHSKQRCIQRFKLMMHQHERDNIEAFLLREFNTSKLEMNKIMTPFYCNKIETKYGKNSFKSYSKYLTFCGYYCEQKDMFIIRTIYL